MKISIRFYLEHKFNCNKASSKNSFPSQVRPAKPVFIVSINILRCCSFNCRPSLLAASPIDLAAYNQTSYYPSRILCTQLHNSNIISTHLCFHCPR